MTDKRQAAQDDELLRLESEEARFRARNGLLNFTKYTFPEFRISWHHRVMCRVFNKFAAGQIPRLIVTAPPRHGKSEIISRRLPAYMLGRNPDARIIAASYNADLASAMNRDVQRIITAPEYRELFPGTRLNEKNIRTVADGTWLRNAQMFEIVGRRGMYKCAGVGGGLTGAGGSTLLLDDYLRDWRDAMSKTVRDAQWNWYRSVFRTRAHKNANIAATVTRWHEDDIVGRLLALQESDPKADQWMIINLPAINEDGPSEHDERAVGDALWPSEFPLEELERVKVGLGTRIFISLYQQRPSPPEGTVIKREWWKFYTERPATYDRIGVSCDATFKDKEKSDFFVLQLWGLVGARKYLLDQVRARMAYPEQKKAIKSFVAKWFAAFEGDAENEHLLTSFAKWIEDAANGAALVADLTDDIPGMIAVPAKGSKEARAESIAPQAEAGNLWLPDPSIAPWVHDFLEEWAAFPNGANDDQCFVAGTLVATTRGDVVIENISAGDRVLTPFGTCRVAAAGPTGSSVVVQRHGLTGTPDHPCIGAGVATSLDTISLPVIEKLTWKHRIRWALLRSCNSLAQPTDSWEVRNAIICLSREPTLAGAVRKVCTSPYTNTLPAQKCRLALRCITRTAIHLITDLTTYSVYRAKTIAACLITDGKKVTATIFRTLSPFVTWHARGIGRPPGGPGTVRTRWARNKSEPPASVHTAAKNTWARQAADSAGAVAPQKHTREPTEQPQPSYAKYAAQHLSTSATDTTSLGEPAQCSAKPQPVYNLRTAHGVYYANGILVSNCDATSLGVSQIGASNGLTFDWAPVSITKRSAWL